MQRYGDASAAQSAFRPVGLVASLVGFGVFFGARVARQPMTTNAIRTATKIPNCSMSLMIFSIARVGWHHVLRSNPGRLAIFPPIRRASSGGAVVPLSRRNTRFHESVTSHQKTKTPIITNAPRTISSIFLIRNIELICERGRLYSAASPLSL